MGIDIPVDEISKYLNEKPQESEKPAGKEVLSGSVSFTPKMREADETYAKDLFPQPGEMGASGMAKAVAFPIQALINGLQAVPEDLSNAVAGVAQQGVPQQKRMTYADVMRKIDPRFISPNEMQKAPAFQAALQQHPAMNAVWNPFNFAGGFMFPVGAAEGIAAKPIAKLMQTPLPQIIAQGGKTIPIVRDVPQVMRALGNTSRTNPWLHGGAVGAGYGTAFGAGQQFGQTKTLPSPQQALATGAAGGAMGAGIGKTASVIQNKLLQLEIARLAKTSPTERMPQASAPTPRDVLPSAPALKSNMQTMVFKALAKNPKMSAEQAGTLEKELHDHAAPFHGESDEHDQAIAEAIRDFHKEIAGRAAKAETKSESALQRDDKMAAGMGKQQADIGRQGSQTGKQDAEFSRFADMIDQVVNPNDLGAIEDEIFTPGAGPTGRPLLRSDQRQQLQRRLHRKFKELTPEEQVPGGSEGTPPGSPAVPGKSEPVPQNSPNSGRSGSSAGGTSSPAIDNAQELPKTAPDASPPQAPPVVPQNEPQASPTPKTAETKPDAAYNPVRDFIQGAFRKTINLKRYGNRENRYKFAVSVDALGHAAGLPQEKINALQNWVSAAAEARREKTYKETELERLVKWAYENEDHWVGGRGKVQFERGADEQKGDYYQLLTHMEREGRFKTLALRTRQERYFERKTETFLEHVRTNLMRFGFERAGEEPEFALKVDARPKVNTTLNGIAERDNWQENQDGSLKLGNEIRQIQMPPFVPPRNADELFAQAERLHRWASSFGNELSDVYAAKGDHNHLNGLTPADVMGEAFQNLGVNWKAKGRPGATPVVHVWHVDKAEHVSTVRFDQPASRGSWPQHMADLQAKYDQVVAKTMENKGKDGNISYEAIWANPKLLSQITSMFPGDIAAIPIVAMLISKSVHKVVSGLARNTKLRALAVGTIDDIMRNNTRFGGDEISSKLHGMLGEIASAFFHDEAGILHKVGGGEELSEMLNEYKGVLLTRSNYRKVARQAAIDAGKDTEVEVGEAIRKADTVFMIRSKYDKLAKEIQPYLEEQDIRKVDSQSGKMTKEGRKFYTPDDLDDNGAVKKSAYDALFHDGLRELHKSLTLQSGATGSIEQLFGEIASRKSQSIMANNPRVALKNLFDQAPITLAYYHKHFFTAAADLMSNAGTREAVERMPVIPQADMGLVRLEEQMKNEEGRKPEDIYQAAAQGMRKVDHFLQTKIDPLFKGRAPLVSAADRMYTKISALASLNKIAERYGIPRHEFMSDLMGGVYKGEQEHAIFSEMSRDLTRVYNSVAPHLNKDLFASSLIGKGTNQYATPGRRAFRLMWDWARSDNPADKLKFVASFAGMVALGGSGAVPQSLQAIIRLAGAATGHSKDVEDLMQNYDRLNVLRHLTGIDYSHNFGPDVVTGAQPALEAIQKMGSGATDSVMKGDYGKLAAGTLLEGLSLLPKIGPFGFDVWQSGMKNVAAAEENAKKYYFTAGPKQALKSVTIYGYDYNDALRDFLFGGASPASFPREQETKMRSAENSDAKFRASRDIIPSKQSTANDQTTLPLNVFPTKDERSI